jgi:hypothetical protein
MLSAGQILFAASVGGVVSLAVLAVYARWSRPSEGIVWREAVLQALVVGLSILVWRAAGNTQTLNDDPIPLVSPNDVLCPGLTYIGLGLYPGTRLGNAPDWQRTRALLTLVSFVVNVVTI